MSVWYLFLPSFNHLWNFDIFQCYIFFYLLWNRFVLFKQIVEIIGWIWIRNNFCNFLHLCNFEWLIWFIKITFESSIISFLLNKVLKIRNKFYLSSFYFGIKNISWTLTTKTKVRFWKWEQSVHWTTLVTRKIEKQNKTGFKRSILAGKVP